MQYYLIDNKLYKKGAVAERYTLMPAEEDGARTRYIVCPFTNQVAGVLRFESDGIKVNNFNGNNIQVKEM